MKRLLFAITAVFLIMMGAAGVYDARMSTAIPQTQKVIYSPQSLLAQANRLRAAKGVAPLKLDERLNQSAQWKADDMKAFNYFGHVKPGETTPNGVMKGLEITGKSCSYMSENLNSGELGNNPFNTVSGWPTSKPHYEAIIASKYDTTGFGSVETNGQVYYVQHFCDLR